MRSEAGGVVPAARSAAECYTGSPDRCTSGHLPQAVRDFAPERSPVDRVRQIASCGTVLIFFIDREFHEDHKSQENRHRRVVDVAESGAPEHGPTFQQAGLALSPFPFGRKGEAWRLPGGCRGFRSLDREPRYRAPRRRLRPGRGNRRGEPVSSDCPSSQCPCRKRPAWYRSTGPRRAFAPASATPAATCKLRRALPPEHCERKREDERDCRPAVPSPAEGR